MAHFTLTLALPDRTGAARMACYFCRALRAAGHGVLLLHGPPPATTILDELAALEVELSCESGLARPLSPLLPWRVAACARRRGSRAILGFNQRDRAVAVQAAWLLGVPGVIHVGNLHHFWGPLAPLKKLYYRWSVRRFARLAICTSAAVRRELVADFGLPPDQTWVLPNGIDLPPAGAALPRATLGIPSEALALLTVGRLDYQKGQDLLIQALRSLPRPAWLGLVGGVTEGAGRSRSEAYRDRLYRLVDEAGLQRCVAFLGWREDVPALLRTADAYVHPARWEGPPGGLALLEAMAAGLPVLCSDSSGTLEGFQDAVHGFMVRAGEVESLHRALRQVAALGPEARREMGARGRALVAERYDVERLSRRFVERLENLA